MSPLPPAIVTPFQNRRPRISPQAHLAPGAVVVGDVVIGSGSCLWWGVVARGDEHFIRIGERTNVQDGTIIHVTYETHPTVIGNDVTIGHGARLHGCTIGDGALVGIGAIVLDGAALAPGAMLAAGAVLTPGKQVPGGELWAGNPARKLRDLRSADRDYMVWDAAHYVRLAAASFAAYGAGGERRS